MLSGTCVISAIAAFGDWKIQNFVNSSLAIVAQLVEHPHGKGEVIGSIPINGSNCKQLFNFIFMEQEQTKGSGGSKFLFAGAAVVALAVVAGLIFWKPKDENVTLSEVNGSNSGQISERKEYADGTYSALGSYISPAGEENVYVTLVLEGNLIKDASVEVRAENPGSKMMQEAFAAGFKTEVVGKNIDEVSLVVVNGSSLTPKGFMDALSKIKMEARVSA